MALFVKRIQHIIGQGGFHRIAPDFEEGPLFERMEL